MNNKYIILGPFGSPLARKSDEVNPYLWNSLVDACHFAQKELSENEFRSVSIAQIIVLDTIQGEEPIGKSKE